MHALLNFNDLFFSLSSLNENQDITDGHIALPVMLQMNQRNQTPKELQ